MMLSAGILLSELAAESGSSAFGGVWPFFLAVFVLFVVVTGYFACRSPAPGEGEERGEEE